MRFDITKRKGDNDVAISFHKDKTYERSGCLMIARLTAVFYSNKL